GAAVGKQNQGGLERRGHAPRDRRAVQLLQLLVQVLHALVRIPQELVRGRNGRLLAAALGIFHAAPKPAPRPRQVLVGRAVRAYLLQDLDDPVAYHGGVLGEAAGPQRGVREVAGHRLVGDPDVVGETTFEPEEDPETVSGD